MSGTALPFLTDAMLAIQRWRVATQVRNTHLTKRDKLDEDTRAVFDKILETEEFIEERVARLITQHPAYSWFSRVKGVGKENIAKVVGLVDISRAPTISSLWKFAGYHVVDGKGAKKTKGQKLEYNSVLRTMCWRLGGSLMKAKGKYFDFYLAQKERSVRELTERGVTIVPAAQLPKDKNNKHYEPEGMISEGHVHARALRKMVKLFLAQLWLVWREAEGLPTRAPYVHEHQGHTTIITAWEMVDKPEKKPRRRPKAAA